MTGRARHPIRSPRIFATGIAIMVAAPLVGRFVPGEAAQTIAFVGGVCALQGMHLLPVRILALYRVGVILLGLGAVTCGMSGFYGWYTSSLGASLLLFTRVNWHKKVHFWPWGRRKPDPTDADPVMRTVAALLYFGWMFMGDHRDGVGMATVLATSIILLSAAQIRRIDIAADPTAPAATGAPFSSAPAATDA